MSVTQIIKKSHLVILPLLALGALTMCTPYVEAHFETRFSSSSPNQKNFIYDITTRSADGTGPYEMFLYFSDDPNGALQLPEPRYKIPLASGYEAGAGCLMASWKSDYEVTIYYCLDRGTYHETTQFEFKGNQITLHFERAPNCNPEQVGELLLKLKGETNLCRYYFPEEAAQQSTSIE